MLMLLRTKYNCDSAGEHTKHKVCYVIRTGIHARTHTHTNDFR